MLEQIYIKNFVIVDELTVEFHNGFNVLTGETGAGKSIWIDAVMLALGARADSHVIRDGASQCDIVLTFDIQQQQSAKDWLTEHDFEADDECLIKRSIKSNGKSKSTINGQPCSQNLIQAFSEKLILVHNQNQHQSLMKKQFQREQLDHFAGITAEVKLCQTYYNQWHMLEQEIKQKQLHSGDHTNEIEYLQYQLKELEQMELQAGEWEELSAEHQTCHNAKSLINSISKALEAANEHPEQSATTLIEKTIHHIEQIDSKHKSIKSIREYLNTAHIHLQEACTEMQDYRESLDLSPERLHTIEKRLEKIYELARKHHTTPNELPDIIPSLEKKISDLNNFSADLIALQEKQKDIMKKYNKVGDKISRARKQHAEKLSAKVSSKMQLLNFNGGTFKIELHPEKQAISAHGKECIEFYIATNAGMAARPMHKIVSGGELSRINLALQVITAEYYPLPTLIFDEVDSGIGGHTAKVVAELLNQIGDESQVLCITHLPQVAAKAHHHYQINKSTTAGQTISRVAELTKQERIQEITRMLGGKSEVSHAHAKEMLA